MGFWNQTHPSCLHRGLFSGQKAKPVLILPPRSGTRASLRLTFQQPGKVGMMTADTITEQSFSTYHCPLQATVFPNSPGIVAPRQMVCKPAKSYLIQQVQHVNWICFKGWADLTLLHLFNQQILNPGKSGVIQYDKERIWDKADLATQELEPGIKRISNYTLNLEYLSSQLQRHSTKLS